jgi:PDZ domain-containing protein
MWRAQFLAHAGARGRSARHGFAAIPRDVPRSGIALPAGMEMDGIASLGRVSSMNRSSAMNRLSSRLALSLLLGLAWLSLAPIASAESRVWIGVTIYDDASARIRDGTVVLVVHEGSPAYAMGVRPGDVLVDVDGLRIADSNHFICLIAAHLPGETIKLSTIRAGERRIATVTLAERPPDFYVTPHDCGGSVSQTALGRLGLATWSSKWSS